MSFLGELLKREGLIQENQLQEALIRQEQLSTYRPIGHILMDFTLLTAEDLNRVLDRYRKRLRVGHILIKMGAITNEQLQVALQMRVVYRKRLGETLMALGYVSEDTFKQALGFQLNVPFIDLSLFQIDPKLQKLINASYATKYKIIVLSQVGKNVKLVMDDPTERFVLDDLRAMGFTVNVAIANFHGLVPSRGPKEDSSTIIRRRPAKSSREPDGWWG